MMKIEVFARCYNIYGVHPSFGYIGDFLVGRESSFGSAVQEIEITFHFPTSGPPKKTLGGSYKRFHENRRNLPKVVYRRKKGQMVINVASGILDGSDWKKTRGVRFELFNQGVPEVVSAIELCKLRLKKSDDFELDELISICNEGLNRLPRNQEVLVSLVNQWKAQRQEERERLSPWDRLGVDWDDFHSQAREFLDDVFFWDCTHDFAPHGNDTGADLLAHYSEKHRQNPARSAIEYLNHLASSWGYRDFSEMDYHSRNESKVGLAFAEVKTNGIAYSDSLQLAQEALSVQREEAEHADDWPHRGERLRTLDILLAKLDSLACKAVDRTPVAPAT